MNDPSPRESTVTIDLDLDPELETMPDQLAAESNVRPEELAARFLTQRIEVHYAQHRLTTDAQARPDNKPGDQTTSPPTANH